MPTRQIKENYRIRRTDFARKLENTDRRINLISSLRLFVAVVALTIVYFAFKVSMLWVVVTVLAIIFFVLVKAHANLFTTKAHLKNLVSINDNEIKALELNLEHFHSGAEFIDPHHPYAHDLDIFGEGSLYQYLNRCNTLNGRKKFGWHLAHPLAERISIEDQQHALRELSSRMDFRQNIQATGMEAGEAASDHDQLLQWTRQNPVFKNKALMKVLLIVIPTITISALVATFFVPWVKIILLLGILAQWTMTGLMLKKINVYHDYISRKKNILQKYSSLLYYVEQEEFSSAKLTSISSRAHEAFANIKKLASLVGALDARTNSLAALFVNSFLLYDLQCVYRLEVWRESNAEKLKIWLDAITEIEVLNSFATFHYNNPSYTFASITNELNIRARDLAHPLILQHERVANDLSFGPEPAVLIITGANMAGKSTFLRTLGVNLVLALNGAPVCASTFVCPLINLRSGMRTADSLKDHQSYFFAELNRLKSIMDELRDDRPLLILLDEILKGTNSNDKQAGSIALVKQLLPHPCLALIATHDLVLGDLQNEFPAKIRNYCFEANIENDQLSFDYKLKSGLAQKMNASFLMKKMGIIQ